MWNWNPIIGFALFFTAWRYMAGVWELWRQAGTGRGVTRWQVGAFWAGLVMLFVALISPIDALGEQLFSAHMVQHLLLMQIAPPLLILGAPPLAAAWAVPQRWRRGLTQWFHRRKALNAAVRFLTQPLSAFLLHTAVLWLWHVPVLYELAVRNPVVHAAEHASFFAAGLVYWWSLLRERRTALGVLSLFATVLTSGILGALITFSREIWYPVYAQSTQAFGLTPLEDQQLAGLVMWIPAGTIYIVAALGLLVVWLNRMEQAD